MANAILLTLILISAWPTSVGIPPASQATSGPASAPTTIAVVDGADPEFPNEYELPDITVMGVVTDAQTGKPIADVEIFRPTDPYDDHRNKSDASGHFVIHGVNARNGIWARHPDYFEETVAFAPPTLRPSQTLTVNVQIRLHSGPTIRGRVADPAGHPVSDVTVASYPKETRTNANGEFSLKSVGRLKTDRDYGFEFTKPDYVTERVYPSEIPPEGLSVTLYPCPAIAGRVVDNDGKPVTSFEVYAGPGEEPLDRDCAHAVVTDSNGHFRLKIKERGTAWIGIKAQGYAFWETPQDTTQGDIIIAPRLEQGTVVQGAVRIPKTSSGPIHARLVPQLRTRHSLDGKIPARQRLGAAETVVAKDGTVRFENVRPGRHALVFYGQGVTPTSSWVSIPEEPLELRPVTLDGTGSIFGTIARRSESGKPYASAKGYIGCTVVYGLLEGWGGGKDDFAPRKPIHFKVNGDGQFRVDDVPVGQTSVGFELRENADLQFNTDRAINVLEGRVTEVRVSDDNGPWTLPIRVIVGDGSDKQWESGTASSSPHIEKSEEGELFLNFALRPLSNEPLSYPEDRTCVVERNGTINLPDVHPGRYKLLVSNFDNCASMTVEAPKPVNVHLEAGSVTGIIRENFISPENRVDMWLVSETDRQYVRSIDCYYDGSFAFRFVPPGIYSLFAHDTEFGYCRVGPLSVKDEMVDVGALKLKAGGSLSARVRVSPDKPLPNNMCVVYRDGVSISLYNWRFTSPEDETIAFRNLWPGEWTVILFGDAGVLASGKAILNSQEETPVELKWK